MVVCKIIGWNEGNRTESACGRRPQMPDACPSFSRFRHRCTLVLLGQDLRPPALLIGNHCHATNCQPPARRIGSDPNTTDSRFCPARSRYPDYPRSRPLKFQSAGRGGVSDFEADFPSGSDFPSRSEEKTFISMAGRNEHARLRAEIAGIDVLNKRFELTVHRAKARSSATPAKAINESPRRSEASGNKFDAQELTFSRASSRLDDRGRNFLVALKFRVRKSRYKLSAGARTRGKSRFRKFRFRESRAGDVKGRGSAQ